MDYPGNDPRPHFDGLANDVEELVVEEDWKWLHAPRWWPSKESSHSDLPRLNIAAGRNRERASPSWCSPMTSSGVIMDDLEPSESHVLDGAGFVIVRPGLK
jgi:hypothetical protein